MQRIARYALILLIAALTAATAITLVQWRSTTSRLDRLQTREATDYTKTISNAKTAESQSTLVGQLALKTQNDVTNISRQLATLSNQVNGTLGAADLTSVSDRLNTLEIDYNRLRNCISEISIRLGSPIYC